LKTLNLFYDDHLLWGNKTKGRVEE